METNKQGLLGLHSLWHFWDALGEKRQNQIIDYYKSHPTFFDYNTLFAGTTEGSLTNGDISTLTTLFVLSDLEFCDLMYKQFLLYSPENYLNHSKWGANWAKGLSCIREILNDRPSSESANSVNYYNSITSIDIYWNDAHFFLHVFSKFVYKLYLNGECTIDRFENVFLFEFENLKQIQLSVEKMAFGGSCRNGIIDQYLIYLEKQKRFDECIEIINRVKNLGWTNDFEKRLNRCNSKKNKNGNKS